MTHGGAQFRSQNRPLSCQSRHAIWPVPLDRNQLDPTWNQNKTADALHKSKSALSNDLRVAYAHVGGDKQICAAPTMSAKRRILARRDERNTRLALAELDPTHDKTILTEDFNVW